MHGTPVFGLRARRSVRAMTCIEARPGILVSPVSANSSADTDITAANTDLTCSAVTFDNEATWPINSRLSIKNLLMVGTDEFSLSSRLFKIALKTPLFIARPLAHHDFVRDVDAYSRVLETLQRVIQRTALGAAAAQGQMPAVGPSATLCTANLDSHASHQALQHTPQAMPACMVSDTPGVRPDRPVHRDVRHIDVPIVIE